MDKRNASACEVARKALLKKSPEELTSGNALVEAIEFVCAPGEGSADVLSRLAFLTVLCRQITKLPSITEPLLGHVVAEFSSALEPRAPMSLLLTQGLAHTTKPHPQRAGEALSAVVRMASHLHHEEMLFPLWSETLRQDLSVRSTLVTLGHLIDIVPESLVPSDLFDRLLNDVTKSDGVASVRGSLIAKALARRRSGLKGAEADAAMLRPLLPKLVTEEGEDVVVVSRYLLPPLCAEYPTALNTLLRLLGEAASKGKADECFAAWIMVAAFGVQNGLLPLKSLDQEKLQEALYHDSYRLRIMAFELVSGSKDMLEREVMELVKQGFLWNEGLPQAGGRTDLSSAVHQFFKRLRDAQNAVVRDAKRPKTTPEQRQVLDRRLATAQAFHAWFVDEYITPPLLACREMPAVRAIFALNLLKRYLDVFGDKAEGRYVYTPQRVQALIACQASEFTEMRASARDVISQAPLPLPGFEPGSSATAALLASAKSSINHPRNTQAEAGRAALSILFTKVMQPQGDEAAAAFLDDLLNLLEAHLQRCETDLVSGMVEFPLHGPLSAIAELVQYLDLTTPENQSKWSPLLHRLFATVERVWTVTSKVISLGPQNEDKTAAHEIARAYDVLGDGDDDEDLDHTGLLSGCWRATKEASDLLSAIITAPLKSKGQTLWTRTDVDRAGHHFLTWLHEVRHRGTFSKIAPALGSVVDVARRIEMRDLVKEWLETELQTIGRGHISTLRRSAALPYTILALVSTDADLLEYTVDALVTMARLDTPSPDEAKVHALNCLKILLLDAKHSRWLEKYFERGVTVALQAFGSPNWNVRNGGLIIFSTLSHRSLNHAPRSQGESGTRAALANRQTLASWVQKYPTLLPWIIDFLVRNRRAGPTSLGEHSPLFPVLIILRSLRWSPEGASEASQLCPIVEAYLSNADIQVRTVASQALSSLLNPDQAVEKAKVTATRISHSSLDLNLVHGRLLYLQRLILDVIRWDKVSADDRHILEDRMRESLWQQRKPTIVTAALDCVIAYTSQVQPLTPALISITKEIALSSLRRPAAPGTDLLCVSAAEAVLSQNLVDLLHPSMPEDAHLTALEHIGSAGHDAATLKAVVQLCQSSAGDGVHALAFEVLANWPSCPAFSENEGAIANLVWKRYKKTRCVPLKEAALVTMGRVSSHDPERVAQLAGFIASAADEDQSEPSRMAALQSLEHLSGVLYGAPSPTRAKLQRTLLTLLQDDDIEIRQGAASIVQRGHGLRQPVVQQKAVDLWWSWLEGQLSSSAEEDWEAWLWAKALDSEGVAADLALLRQDKATELFVEEPPNIFRNELIDVKHAADVLAKHGAMSPNAAEVMRQLEQVSGRGIIEADWVVREKARRRLEALNALA